MKEEPGAVQGPKGQGRSSASCLFSRHLAVGFTALNYTGMSTAWFSVQGRNILSHHHVRHICLSLFSSYAALAGECFVSLLGGATWWEEAKRDESQARGGKVFQTDLQERRNRRQPRSKDGPGARKKNQPHRALLQRLGAFTLKGFLKSLIILHFPM